MTRREPLWQRVSPIEAAHLFRRPLPTPVDVINLIWIARFSSYQLYGLMVLPTIYLIGGSIRWMGRLDRELVGKPQAEKLLVVRYRSHRAFLAMTFNPYYLLANKLREAGVERFEASFTHPSMLGEDLRRTEHAVAVHFTSPDGEDRLAALAEHLTGLGARLVYACRETSSFTFLTRFLPTDPGPLTFKQLALFAFDDPETLDGVAGDATTMRELAGGDVAVHLYAREKRDAYRLGRTRRTAVQLADRTPPQPPTPRLAP